MALHLVCCDLHTPAKDYRKLSREVERLGGKRVLNSQWALRSGWSAEELCRHLSRFVGVSDRLLVTELHNWATIRSMFDINDL
jgi:hypothetical protein